MKEGIRWRGASRFLADLRQGTLVRSGVAGLADQALISATTFGVMVLLARELSRSGFGSFVLVYTALLFAASVQYCVIAQPLNVLLSTLTGRERSRYATSTATQQLLLCAVFALMALTASGVALIFGWGAAVLLLMLAIAVVAWQLQEFVRRVFFAEGRLAAAASNDVLSYGGQLIGLVVLWRLGHLDAVNALAVLAGTSAVAAAIGAFQLRHLFDASSVWPGHSFTENWRLGKWLLGGNLAGWTSGQLYPFLIAVFVGVSATGALRAVQTVLGPTNILLIGLDTSLSPVAARTYSEGGFAALGAFVTRIYALTWPLITLYCVVVAILAEPILRILYGQQYTQYAWLLPVIALTQGLHYLHTPISIALRGSRRTSPVMEAYVASTVVVLTFGVAAIYLFGVAGAAMGMIAHGVIVNLVLWKRFRESRAVGEGIGNVAWVPAYERSDSGVMQ